MASEPLSFVCPSCKGPLVSLQSGFTCAACERQYPIICGIPDFRLAPDPYTGMAEDRSKGEWLFEAGKDPKFDKTLRPLFLHTKKDAPHPATNSTTPTLS